MAKLMPALRKQVRIYRRRDPVSDYAVDPELSDLIFIAWADVVQLSDRERYYANQNYPGATYRVVIRWPNLEIGPADWIEFNDRANNLYRLDIMSVKDPEDGRGIWLQMLCGTEHRGAGETTHR